MNPDPTFQRPSLLQASAVITIFAALTISLSDDANGITINVTYSEDIVTSYDPNGSRLLAIAQAAATIWEDYYPNNNFSISIDFCYENLPTDSNGQTLGRADAVTDNISMQASPLSPWFFDTTPLDHSEFDFSGSGNPTNGYLGQTLYRDVGVTNQFDWFNGFAPDLFEIGYRGAAVAPEALGRNDILSTAIHEMGHILGVNFDPADETWDPPPFQLGGSAIEIEPDPSDSGHLATRSALMCKGCGAANLRRLPSAVDILAVAADESWSIVDLPRQDFLTGSVWNSFGFVIGLTGWEGGRAPDASDDVFIRHGGDVTLGVSPSVANLLVSDSSGIFTDANTLSVSDLTIVEAALFEPPYAHLTVAAGGRFEGFQLVLRGGILEMDEGEVDVNSLAIENNSGLAGEIHGHGTVLAASLVNDGVIRADGGTLTMNAIAANLDGASDEGLLEASTGDLVVMGIVMDFHSLATIGAGHSIEMSNTWTLASEGLLDLRGAATTTASLLGATVLVEGNIDVDRMGTLQTLTVVFEKSANVQTPDTSDRLILDTDALLRGGSYTGAGAIEQQGDVRVQADTILNTGVYDWGNSVGTKINDTTVEEDVVFTVLSLATGTTDNEYRGTIHLNNGVLNVQTSAPWTLPTDFGNVDGVRGSLFLHNNPEYLTIPQVQGSALTLGGLLRSTGGRGEIQTQLVTLPSAEIDVQNAASLSLEGHVTYDGPLIHGNGTLVQNADADVIATTTIGTKFFDWDGDEGGPSNTTISSGAALTIDSQQIEVDSPATDGYGGHVTVEDSATLIVITSGPWRLDGTMTLNGQPVAAANAIVDGSDINNYGTIEGNGRIQANVENHGTLSPGLSAGAQVFDVGLTLATDSLVEIELGGLTPVAEYDQLIVNQFGTANLGGALDLSLINGFVPQDGDAFTILTAGVISGSFMDDLVTPVNFPTGVTFEVIYEAKKVVLQFDVQFISADFDIDGDIDGHDFLVWQRGGSPNPLSNADLALWRAQFGVGALSTASGVPEPGGLTLAVFLLLGVANRNRP